MLCEWRLNIIIYYLEIIEFLYNIFDIEFLSIYSIAFRIIQLCTTLLNMIYIIHLTVPFLPFLPLLFEDFQSFLECSFLLKTFADPKSVSHHRSQVVRSAHVIVP